MEFEEQIVAVRKPTGPLVPGLEAAYRQIGEKFGYMMVQSPLFLMLKKADSQVGFELQFGNNAEFEESFRKLTASGCDLCFFITSSRVKTMHLEDARGLLLRRFTLGSQRYIFIDIETGRTVRANFEWEKFSKEVDRPDWSRPGPLPTMPLFRGPRRKPVLGRRGEHKEQD